METDNLAVVEAQPETILPKDKKEAAFLMPAKEDIAGFTVHAFAKSRKGFVIATGNEILNSEKHIADYKAAHPEWMNELSTPDVEMDLAGKLVKAKTIENVDDRTKAISDAQAEYDAQIEWTVLTKAVPDFSFHMTALAYLCVSTPAEISKLVGKSKEYFAEKVTTWADVLTDDQWDKLTIRAFQELIESNIGADFKVKEEKTSGAPAAKN